MALPTANIDTEHGWNREMNIFIFSATHFKEVFEALLGE